jgi:hypothetical protein
MSPTARKIRCVQIGYQLTSRRLTKCGYASREADRIVSRSLLARHHETWRDIAHITDVGLAAVLIMYIPESCRWNTLGGVTSPHKYVESVGPQELTDGISYL